MNRRIFLALVIAGLAGPASAEPQPSDRLGAVGDPPFLAWLNDYYGRAIAQGLPKAVLDKELMGLAADPRVLIHDAGQPEFARPISAYLEGVLTAGTINLGRQKRAALPFWDRLEASYGVPRDILIGVWAMETGYGANQGSFDVIPSLATLAASGRRREWAENEISACIRIIASGEATRAQLKGSWAGAMGQTQMLPSTFLTSAVDADGDGKRDIWNSSADALGSAANLLVKGGWRHGVSWAREVILPAGFDYALSEGPLQFPAWWEAKGVRRADKQAWDLADADAPAQLAIPAGAAGPAFLLLPNHFAIRQYNNSISYALAVGLLADRIGGGGPLATAWPHEVPLSLTDRRDAQLALTKLGFDPGVPDGVIGLGTRQALRGWQKARHLTVDGYLTPTLIARLRAEANPGMAGS